MAVTAKSCIYFKIPQSVRLDYRAAGILPFARLDDKILFLLGKEYRKQHYQSWSDFGGKRDKKDKTIEDTAWREFTEETNQSFNTLKDTAMSQMNEVRNGAVWNASGKYLLYFVEVPYISDLPSWKDEKSRPRELNKDEVQWFTSKSLVDALATSDRPKKIEAKSEDGQKVDSVLLPFFSSTLYGGRRILQALHDGVSIDSLKKELEESSASTSTSTQTSDNQTSVVKDSKQEELEDNKPMSP
jgi:ADP-ribose pyrophosphatase YjhB (NUDIX family)